jgi:hypothetical protein
MVALNLSGCGDPVMDDVSPSATACESGVAQITVGDGFLQTLCGCQGLTAPVFFHAGTPLACTVTSGTMVFFHYLGNKLPHQIISTSVATFPTSPVSDPDSATTYRSHPVRLSAPGAYTFTDNYNFALSGTITVL